MHVYTIIYLSRRPLHNILTKAPSSNVYQLHTVSTTYPLSLKILYPEKHHHTANSITPYTTNEKELILHLLRDEESQLPLSPPPHRCLYLRPTERIANSLPLPCPIALVLFLYAVAIYFIVEDVRLFWDLWENGCPPESLCELIMGRRGD